MATKRKGRELDLVDIGEGYLSVKPRRGLSFRYRGIKYKGKLTLTSTRIRWTPEGKHGKHGVGSRTVPGPRAKSLDLDKLIEVIINPQVNKKGNRRG